MVGYNIILKISPCGFVVERRIKSEIIEQCAHASGLLKMHGPKNVIEPVIMRLDL